MALQIGGKSSSMRLNRSRYNPFTPIIEEEVITPELLETPISLSPYKAITADTALPVSPQANPYTQLETTKFNEDIVANGGNGSYLDNLAGVESNNKWDAYNKGSGAYGKYQFIPSTEKAYAKKLGMSIAEARTPAGQTAMVNALTADNRKGLIRAGINPTQENLYMAHNLGLGSALSALRGGPVKMKYLKGQGVSSISEWRRKFAPRFN